MRKIEMVWNSLCDTIFGKRIPIINFERPRAALSFDAEELKEKNKVIVLGLLISLNSLDKLEEMVKERYYPYFNKEEQNLLDGNILVMNLLHEIGHAKTLTCNLYADDEPMRELIYTMRDQSLADQMYRELKSEAVADQWAFQWAREHMDYVRELSKFLRE